MKLIDIKGDSVYININEICYFTATPQTLLSFDLEIRFTNGQSVCVEVGKKVVDDLYTALWGI